MTRAKGILLRVLLTLVSAAAFAFAVVFFVLQSDWFKNLVRERVISITQDATGGRVEIGKFNYDWRRLTVRVEPFVLHGKEFATAAPLFRADRIEIGLKVISLLEKKVDIALLSVEKPAIHITVAPDGTSNLPSPKATRSNRTLVQQLIDLKVRHFAINNGFADYNQRRMELDLQGEDLRADVRYEPMGPRYLGDLSLRELRTKYQKLGPPLAVTVSAKLALDESQLRILSARMAMAKSSIDLGGVIRDFAAPHGDFDVAAHLSLKDLHESLRLPISGQGEIGFAGKAVFGSVPFTYKLTGKVTARGLDFDTKAARLGRLSFASGIEITPAKLVLANAAVDALNGSFRGSAELRDWKRFTLNGVARDFPLQELARASDQNAGELSGAVTGPVHAEGVITNHGVEGLKLEAKLDIAPGQTGVPVEGSLDLKYDQPAGRLELGNSTLRLGSTRIGLAGALGERLAVHVTSSNLRDVLPVFPLFGEPTPKELTISLKNGSVRFDGSVSGPLRNPRISGSLDASHFVIRDREFDRLVAGLDLTRSDLNFRTLALDQGALHVQGNGEIGLADWKAGDASRISAALTVRGADLSKLISDAGMTWPAHGTVSGSLNLNGTLGAPQGTASIQSANVEAYDEQFGQVRADLVYNDDALELVDGGFTTAGGHFAAKGSYTHSKDDWKTGRLRFDVTGDGIAIERLKHVADFYKGASAQVNFQVTAAANVVKGDFNLASLTGQTAVRNAVVEGHQYGSAVITANTNGSVLDVKANVDLRGTRLEGSGKWNLADDYAGQAEIQIPRLSVRTLHDLAPGPHVREQLPFDGFIQGSINISVPLKKLDTFRAEVSLDTVQINADPSLQPIAGAQPKDLVLRNREGVPVVFEAGVKGIDIKSAEFTAKDTTVQATGRLAFDSKNPWDLNLDGNINLAVLRIFNPDLLGAGNSMFKATVRGPLTEPQIDGHLELKNASLFLKDVPNGVSEANGLILFDRSRATVQSLTALTGGGRITFQPGSFVGFRGPALLYRLQAEAANVRYRSVEGVSITASALLNLNGTSDNSLLSGTLTIERASFNPRTDVGGLLASTERPISAPAAPNEYLRGIQFDVRVLTAQSLEVQTSMTRDVEAEANIRVRGTPEKPVVLGNITVSSGQIEFFGNKYTITRGEVSFFNPAKIEPILNMDLETRVRGITVDITFAGPLDKLNFSYRSDPPFDSNQILALLAVGRDPTATGGLAGSQSVTNTSYLATGSNALLGQAITPATSGLERIFGVSHIKIDPQFTDISTIPQARLTLEQQISKDVTLTYITNLTRTSEQIVRVQLDFSRQWSVVALRDENGVFGVDVQYRKRFK